MALPLPAFLADKRTARALGAVALVGVLVAVGLGVGGMRPSPGPQPSGAFPFIDCDPDCNVGVFMGPREANEVSVAINPKDEQNIVAAANDYGTPNGDAWVGYYWSRDGGTSWNNSLVPGYRAADTRYPAPCDGGLLPGQGICGFEASGDPVLAADKDGNFFLTGIAFKRDLITGGRTSAVFIAKSTDGGATFPDVQVLFTAVTHAAFHDKEWVATDPKTSDVYVSWSYFSVEAQIAVVHSADSGATWSRPVFASYTTAAELPSVQGSQMEVDNNGTVHLAWVDFKSPAEMRYSKSTDKGRSWSAPQTIGPVTPIDSPQGNSTYRAPTLPDMALDRTNGTYAGSIYVWWPDQAGGDADILQVYSRDGGTTWSNVSRVNNDPEGNGKTQFFPALSVAGNGWVVGVFYDRRDDPANNNLSVYVALSTDGGQSYDTQFNWTDQSFDGEKSKRASGTTFIGDYIGIASTDWFSFGVWCDTRNADNGTTTDVFGAKLLLAPAPPPAKSG
jgi:hypothetical protein